METLVARTAKGVQELVYPLPYLLEGVAVRLKRSRWRAWHVKNHADQSAVGTLSNLESQAVR